MSDWRNLELLDQIAGEIIVPNLDLVLKNLDRLECRIIRFISKNKKTWKDKEDDSIKNETEHTRILVHVYSHKSLNPDLGGYVADPAIAGTKVTINPQTKLLAELVSVNEKFKQNGIPLSSRKLEVRRKDVAGGKNGGNYTTWEWKDLGEAPVSSSDDWRSESLASYKIQDDENSEPQKQKANEPDFESQLSRFGMMTSFDSLSACAKSLREKFPDRLSDIVAAFSDRKSALAAEAALTIAKSKDNPKVEAEKLAGILYPKEPIRRQDLIDFTIEKWKSYSQQTPTTMSDITGDEEDDVPF